MVISKRIVSVFLAWVLLLALGAGQVKAEEALASEAQFMVGESYYFKGEEVYPMDVAPYLKDGRVFMPTRYIANALNINDAQIGWDETSKTVIINNDPLVLNITLGDPLIWLGLVTIENVSEITLVDETGLVMDTVPEIQNGRVMLPLRFIAEALGAEVSWDSATQTVTLIPSFDDPSSTFYRVQEESGLYEAQPLAEDPGETIASPSNDLTALGDQVIAIVNAERAKAGLPALAKGSTALGEACGVRAEELVQLFSHTRPDGSDCFTVLDEFNLNYQFCGENIAWGQATAEEVMESWMNSQGHRENILNPNYTQIGVGVYPAEHGYNWVQLFITPF